MLKGKKLGFIGGGMICEAIFSGALAAGAVDKSDVTICDVSADRLDALAAKYGVHTLLNSADNAGARQLIAGCDIVVLAVKPQYAPALLEVVGGDFAPGQAVFSVMGGVTTTTLEKYIPAGAVVRVMPNTPMQVGKGSAGIAAGSRATQADVDLCAQLFDSVGSSVVVPEGLIDPLTAVSGCGPAFAYLFIEALADGGVEQGLPRATALALAAQTLAGAAEMVLQTGQHPGELKDMVCSPGGGTIAGVHALEDGAFRATVMNAVAKSRSRMEALGKQ